jgi:hypothetical protein
VRHIIRIVFEDVMLQKLEVKLIDLWYRETLDIYIYMNKRLRLDCESTTIHNTVDCQMHNAVWCGLLCDESETLSLYEREMTEMSNDFCAIVIHTSGRVRCSGNVSKLERCCVTAYRVVRAYSVYRWDS